MKKQQVEFTAFSVRIPESLNELIREEAERNKRNRNQQINLILETHYEKLESEKKVVQNIASPMANL